MGKHVDSSKKRPIEPINTMSAGTSRAADTASDAFKRRFHNQKYLHWELINCRFPRQAFLKPEGGLDFFRDHGLGNIGVPCGRCRLCLKKRAKEKALRIDHEASQHADNLFLTLTYRPERLPLDRGLHYRDIQLFLKSLRKHSGQKFKYFVAGEYGAQHKDDPLQGLRPHWHLILFGFNSYDFRTLFKHNKGRPYFIDMHGPIKKAWKHGFHDFSDYESGAGAYCAQYVTKKLGGEPALEKYWRVNDGRVKNLKGWWVQPELSHHSLGLGKKWYERHEEEVRAHDAILVEGKKYPVPRYYDKLYADKYGDAAMAKIHKQRVRNAMARNEEYIATLEKFKGDYTENLYKQKENKEHLARRSIAERRGNFTRD